MTSYAKPALCLILLTAIAACSPQTPDEPERYSVLILNGHVYDGTLTPPTSLKSRLPVVRSLMNPLEAWLKVHSPASPGS